MESASPSQGEKKSYNDDRYWKPELDKSGNGYAVVRFLPTPEGEDMPWVSYWDQHHGFRNGWYIEKSLTTLNKQDPVSEYNTNYGTLVLKQTKRLQENRREDFTMFLMSMLFQTQKILTTRVKFSYTNLVRKFLNS